MDVLRLEHRSAALRQQVHGRPHLDLRQENIPEGINSGIAVYELQAQKGDSNPVTES